MGQPDYYPFILPRTTVGKLQFIHQVITEQRQRANAGAVQSADTGTDVVLDAGTAQAQPPALAPAQSQSQGQPSQGQTQAQQPFFQTGLQQNQGMFENAPDARSPAQFQLH
jgi:hypothetical protein